MGSPPPTRGTLAKAPRLPSNLMDHPRLRGEHGCNMFTNSDVTGSPPPTRGTLYDNHRLYEGEGITPAYAGNTIR